jgi:hypothetical protein
MTIRDSLDISRKFKPQVLAAVREYRASKPWAGLLTERVAKLSALHGKLCDIYGKQIQLETSAASDIGDTACAAVSVDESATEDVGQPKITISGRLSVQRYLTAFHYAVFNDAADALSWGVSLFVRMFPDSASKLYAVGPYLVSSTWAVSNGAVQDGRAVLMSTIIAEARAVANEPNGSVAISEPLPEGGLPEAGNPERN